MEILDNKEEMTRLFEQHNSTVKNDYKCDFNSFKNWVALDGHENKETNEMYIEIPSNQTKSGHAEILDWN